MGIPGHKITDYLSRKAAAKPLRRVLVNPYLKKKDKKGAVLVISIWT